MSTFYIVPSRQQLGQRYAEFLENLFPGRPWPRDAWRELAEAVVEQPDTYVVYREELPDDVPIHDALVRDCGAAVGDEAVELVFAGWPAPPNARRWRIGQSVGQVA